MSSSAWATEKGEAIVKQENIVESGRRGGIFARDRLALVIAEALDAARQEGAREMREKAARTAETTYRFGDVPRDVSDMDAYGAFCLGIKRAARSIRALPLEVPDERP